MHSIDWNDLRFILAVAEAGSLAGAARKLGVNHTTVLRRINAFETVHGVRLFDRLPSGYALTPGGEELLGAARSLSAMVDTLERRLQGRDLRLEGTIRVSVADTLMASILPPILAGFAGQNSGVTLEIAIDNSLANLTKRDADVAIRTSGAAPDTLVGRKAADIGWALYAAEGQAGRAETEMRDLSAADWIVPDDSLADTAFARWLRHAMPDVRVVARANSFVAMRDLAQQGLGVAGLPCYLGDLSPGLSRIGGDLLAGLATPLWVLTHEDLRRSARIAAFTRFVAAEITALQPLISGRGQTAANKAG